jgi:hypothetical protein
MTSNQPMSQLEWSHSGRSQRNSAAANGGPRARGHYCSGSSGLSGAFEVIGAIGAVEAVESLTHRQRWGGCGGGCGGINHRSLRSLASHRNCPTSPCLSASLPLCISLSAALPNEITFDIPGNSTILIAKSSRAIFSSLRFGHRFEVIIACANRTVPAVTAHARLLAANKASESRLQPSSQPQVSRTMHMRSDRRHV